MNRSWEEMLSDPIEGEDYEPAVALCGDHLVPVTECDCLKLSKRSRGGERV